MKKYLFLSAKSFEENGVKTHKELWEKVGSDCKGFQLGVLTDFVEKKQDDDEPKRFKVTLSTDAEDRHGEIVRQNFTLKNFKNNPVVLDSHNYGSIFHILGTMPKIGKREGALRGEIEFNTVTFEGFMAQSMVEKGFVRTGSIGFIPLEFDDDGNISKSELLEFSLVSVPANPEALIEKAIQVKEAEEPEEELGDEPEDPKKENGVVIRKNPKLKAIQSLGARAEKEAERRKELLTESLAVIQQLQSSRPGKADRKKMVNRAIRQLLKAK